MYRKGILFIPKNLFRRKKIMQNNISIGDTSKITGV